MKNKKLIYIVSGVIGVIVLFQLYTGGIVKLTKAGKLYSIFDKKFYLCKKCELMTKNEAKIKSLRYIILDMESRIEFIESRLDDAEMAIDDADSRMFMIESDVDNLEMEVEY